MSSNNGQNKEAQAPTLPDPDQALQTIVTGVYQQVFFDKLASYGREPSNAADANSMLEIAGKLRVVSQDPTIKAAASKSVYGQAKEALDKLASGGRFKQAFAQEQEVAMRNAARQLAADPNLYNAVLSIKAAEANTAAQQLGVELPADDENAEA